MLVLCQGPYSSNLVAVSNSSVRQAEHVMNTWHASSCDAGGLHDSTAPRCLDLAVLDRGHDTADNDSTEIARIICILSSSCTLYVTSSLFVSLQTLA
jgi:hypothetical protein